MKIEKLKPGMTIYDVRRSTGLQVFNGEYEWWPVYIHEINLDKGEVLISWNGNPDYWIGERRLKNYRYHYPGELKEKW
jgi:hypothetical protein